MKLKWIGAAFAVLIAGAAGCSEGDETKTLVEPQAKGQRGESCQARNDCQDGLACIAGTCSRNDFEVSVSPKHCDQIDCQIDEDCCGGKPLEAPAKCNNRELICTVPTLPNCTQSTCTSNDTCGDGVCGAGVCSSSVGQCMSNADCADECVSGVCTLSLTSCTASTDCFYNGQTCTGRVCDCTNPLYDPFDPVCTDPDCVDVCTLRCREERCVNDNSCEDDVECIPFGLTYCEGGLCVECLEDEDCNEELGETCVDNQCETPCLQNEECPLFQQCIDGDCVETGCSSDRECVLAANLGNVSSEDARLSKCLPSELNPDIFTCKIPCENDGSCSEFQVCDAGYCRFIGCETDEECRGYLGLVGIDPDLVDFVPRAVCRE